MRPFQVVGGGGGGGVGGGREGAGYLFPCCPEKKSAFSFVPQNQNLAFLCFLFPKIAFVPLFPSVLDFCFLVPLK